MPRNQDQFQAGPAGMAEASGMKPPRASKEQQAEEEEEEEEEDEDEDYLAVGGDGIRRSYHIHEQASNRKRGEEKSGPDSVASAAASAGGIGLGLGQPETIQVTLNEGYFAKERRAIVEVLANVRQKLNSIRPFNPAQNEASKQKHEEWNEKVSQSDTAPQCFPMHPMQCSGPHGGDLCVIGGRTRKLWPTRGQASPAQKANYARSTGAHFSS